MAYTLTVNYDNPPVAIITLTSDTAFSTAYLCRFKVYSDNAGAQLVANSGWFTPEEGSLTISYTFSSLPSGAYYVTAESDQPQTFVSLQEVVLADNTPRTATQAQWEDLASKVKAKQDVLISGTNIKTINSTSLLGSGDISISGTGTITEVQANGTSVATSGVANIPAATTSAYGVTELSDSVTSTSTALAATANAVNTAYQNGAFYGTCDTAAATAAKEVTCTNFALQTGVFIAIKFDNANSAETPTLNVNNTGAKALYTARGYQIHSGAWAAGEVKNFVYDGTKYIMVGSAPNILFGTGAPTSALGAYGDIYVQYSA